VWLLFLDDATSTSVDPHTASPQLSFLASHPNPFRAQTAFEYSLPAATAVRLVVYGPSGRRVATLVDRVQSAGLHAVTWGGRTDAGDQVASGTYFCRLEAGTFEQVRRIILVR
jgi:hypothetical protein